MILKITPSSVAGTVAVPGSKSHTIRAIAGALLAEGTSIVRSPLLSFDTASTLAAAVEMGAKAEKFADRWEITGCAGTPAVPGKVLDMGNSGTGLRMLTAAAALANGQVSFTGDESLCSRGMKPLLDALRKLGVGVTAAPGDHAPLSVKGALHGGKTQVEALCSQYLSALLFAAPCIKNGDLEIEVTKLSEEPYVEITLNWLRKLGAEFTASKDLMHFTVPGNQKLRAFDSFIPADFSTAAFPLGAGIVAGRSTGVTIQNLDFNDAQGDKAVFKMLESLGAKLQYNPDNSVTVYPGKLSSGELDLGQTPDALPLLAAVAAVNEGTVITLGNAGQARNKETDRIACMTSELRKMGAIIEEKPDAMIITGSKLHGAVVNSFKDHRLAMALAVAALVADGTTEILDAESCAVTYPDFIKDFQALGADFKTQAE